MNRTSELHDCKCPCNSLRSLLSWPPPEVEAWSTARAPSSRNACKSTGDNHERADGTGEPNPAESSTGTRGSAARPPCSERRHRSSRRADPALHELCPDEGELVLPRGRRRGGSRPGR